MSRFVNLEFGGQPRGTNPAQTQTVVKDEAFYQREAQTAFEEADFEKALRSYAKSWNSIPTTPPPGRPRCACSSNWIGRRGQCLGRQSPGSIPARRGIAGRQSRRPGPPRRHPDALAFSDAAVGENGASPCVWLARGDVLLAAREALAGYCIDKALMLAQGDWVAAWAGGAHPCPPRSIFARAGACLQQAVERNPGALGAVAGTGPLPGGPGADGRGGKIFHPGRELNRQDRGRRPRHDPSLLARRGRPLAGWWRRIKK